MEKGLKQVLKRIKNGIHRTIDTRGENIRNKFLIWRHRVLQRKVCDSSFFDNIKDRVEQIPDSNGQRFYEAYKVRIGIIADEFLFHSFQGIADFLYITPDNYKQLANEVEILLVVSAWRGLNNEWRFMGTEGSEANRILYKVIQYYKEHNKTVIFYSKEDPPNYDHFLPIAGVCDIIFTSAEEMVERYKEDCNSNRVYTLRFGINPLYHNPIGIRKIEKQDAVIFSGSWAKKYPVRTKELDIIFKGVLSSRYKLKIIDRNFMLDSIGFFFPFKYYKYISPSIQHEYLQKVHKLFNWAININSVNNSRTMFANRVYELQAIGNLMLSNKSIGVEEQFPEIFIIHNHREVVQALGLYNDEEIYEHQIAGVRRVMTGETTFDRIGELLKKIGKNINQPVRKVLVIAKEMTDEIKKDFENQSYKERDLVELSQVTQIEPEKYDLWAVWGTDRYYGEYYLEDMINAFKYTDSNYVTKHAIMKDGKLAKGIEHDYVNEVRDVFATVFWSRSYDVDLLKYFIEEKKFDLANGYSIDHFNYTVQSSKGR